jgi:hypothetical protein
MKKVLAIVLVLVGLPMTIVVSCFLAVIVFDVDPGKIPGGLFGMIVPGLAIFALTRNLWTADAAPNPNQDGAESKSEEWADTPDRDDRIKKQAHGIWPHVKASAPSTEGISPPTPASSWEDNPYRLRRPVSSWEDSFADTGLGPIVALACLVGPIALAIGLIGGLFLRGPRARRKAWIMVAVAAPATVVWVVVSVFGNKG